MKGESLIRLVDVSKTYRLGGTEVQALSGVNLSIKRGSFTWVTGPNGSGRATLLSIIGCISRPSKGRVLICGTDTTRLSEESLGLFRRRCIGSASNAFSLIPDLTAMENLEIGLRLNGETGRGVEEKAIAMLGAVGLEKKRNNLPRDLGTVESRRLAIARSMIGNPPLLVCDEPTAGLSKGGSKMIARLLMEFNSDRGTTLVCGSPKPLEGVPDNQLRVCRGRVLTQEGFDT